ncbi:MAG: ATP-binding protein [bacterium]
MFKLEKAIRSVCQEGVEEILPFIGTLMGFRLAGKCAERIKGIEGGAMAKLIMKSMRDLMIRCAQLEPIVYIIEDLHWADDSSLELLESLFPLAKKHRVLFVNLFRPDYGETSERTLEAIKERCEGCHAEIYVEPLNKQQAEILVHHLTKSKRLPADMQAAVTKRAEGNPFFIEAVVHSFVDEGILQFKNGKLAVATPIEAAAIPATIHEVLMARIDRLDPDTKSLLKIAAVIGKNFFYKILAEVAPCDQDLEAQLAHLKAVQLIQERHRLNEREYLFKHALVQEVAYESILIYKRQELHLRVAAAIESVFAERVHEFYGMLAFHYSQADEMEKAEEYLIRAGAEALKAAASSEALNYYQCALKLYLDKHGRTAEAAKVAMLEKNIAMALYNKGHMAQALPHFDQALACLGKKKPKNQMAAMLMLMGDFAAILKYLYWPSPQAKKKPGEKDLMIFDLQYKKGLALSSIDSKRWFMETVRLFSALGGFDLRNVEGLAGVHSAGSAIFNLSGISFALSKRYLSISRQSIEAHDLKSVLYYKVYEEIHRLFGGSWNEQNEIDEQLINAALRQGELFMLNIYLGCAFTIATARGDFETSRRLIDQISNLSETYDYDWGRFFGNLNVFIYCLQKRELHEKMALLDKSLNLAGSLGVELWSLRILSCRAKAQILTRQLAEAEETLALARKILLAYERVAPHYSREYFISRFMLDVLMLENLLTAPTATSSTSQRRLLSQRARRSGRLALKISSKTADKMPEALRLMGTLWGLMGKPHKALRYLDKSVESAERLGAKPDLARTYMEIGKTLCDRRNEIKSWQGLAAAAFFEKANKLYEELDLKWDLQKLNEIRARLKD